MPSHVYLLAHATHARFKVGKANDILSRARCFGWDEIDFQTSLGLELISEEKARDLERILHGAFGASRVPADEVRAQGGRTDGSTEWLRSECRPRLERLLDELQDLFPHKRCLGHDLAQELRRRQEPAVSADERTRRRQEKLDKAAAKLEERLERARLSDLDRERAMGTLTGPLMEELLRQKATGQLIGVCPDDHDCRVVLLRHGEHPKGDIWGLGLRESSYRWISGSASMVTSSAWMTLESAQLEVVSLSLGRSSSPLKRRLFAEHLRLLHAAPRIDEAELDSIFGPGFLFDEETRDERHRAAEELALRHQRVDERQLALC